jgi:RND family efflux transporter MFP subunit
MKRSLAIMVLFAVVVAAGCGSDSDAGGSPHKTSGNRGGPPPAAAQPELSTAVPIQTTLVQRQQISEHLETNGVLEAENEVDIVARVSGPIVSLDVEEGMELRKGQLLARIDDREYANQLDIARVSRDDALRAFDRTKASWSEGLVSQEAYDTSLARLESAEAQLEAKQILLDYTQVRAPFSGKIAVRYIRLAEHVNINTPMFRITDFNPLLCRIQVPEKDLSKLRTGQPAHLRVEPFPDEEFEAHVERIRPTVEADTGTVTVTLEVDGRELLRPGMFASVYLETDVHADALVIPSSALVLDSIGDTVFIRDGDTAARREVRLGYRDAANVEILEGLSAGDEVIVLGQDGLADGTPVQVLDQPEPTQLAQRAAGGAGEMTPERVEQIRQRMKERGLSDAEIEERLKQIREGGDRGFGGARGGPGAGARPGGQEGEPSISDLPPQLLEFIRNADAEQLESIKQRMRERGRTEEEITQILTEIRGVED